MKNHLRFLFIIPMFLVSIFLGVNVPKNVSTDSASQNGDFESFSNSYMELLKDNSLDDYEEIFFKLNDDIYMQNNTYMVSSSTFADITGSKVSIKSSNEVVVSNSSATISMSNDENIIRLSEDNIDFMPESATIKDDSATFPIESVAEALGYNLSFTEEKLVLSCPYQTKRLIIKSNSNLDKQGAIKYAEGYDGLHIYQYATEEATIKAYNYYKNLKKVEYVEFDEIITIDEEFKAETTSAEITQNQTYYSWGASYMGVDDYSQYLTNDVGTENLEEVIIAVLDSGLDSDHEWFDGRIVEGGDNFSTAPDENDSNCKWEDLYGHGTHVTGIITDLTLDNVKILPVKVLNNRGSAPTSAIVAGINYVIDLKQNHGVNIRAINMSLGGIVNSTDQSLYNDAINKAYENDILTIVSAGNRGIPIEDHAPSNVEKTIAVGRLAQNEAGDILFRHSGSNYGSFLDLSAPGQAITSAKTGGGVISYSGTSMATPHVTATVSLLYSDPNNNNCSLADIESILKHNAVDLGEDGWDAYYGEGMVNIEYAYANMLDEVSFSHSETNCNTSFDLELSTAIPNTNIYYTLNGSTPSLTNGTLYSNPIPINTTKKIKAVAYVLDNSKITGFSNISTKTYIFNEEDVEDAFVVDDTGTLKLYKGILTELTVPSVVNSITVTKIGEASFAGTSVQNVILPDTVTTIEKDAFAGCVSLQTVYGQSVTEINEFAFQGCMSFLHLTDYYFPKLSTIGNYAFQRCYNLESFSLSRVTQVGNSAFYMDITGCENLLSVRLPNCKTLEDKAFYNCYNINQIYLPKLEIINGAPFTHCITKVVVGKNFNTYSGTPFLAGSTMYGYKGSSIETYATNNGNTFVAIDELNIDTNLPETIEVTKGENRILTIEASGFEQTYQWYSTNDTIDNGVAIEGTTTNTLRLDTMIIGIKKYYVIITDWDNSTVTSNLCTVNTIGETFTITATSIGNGTISDIGEIDVYENTNKTFTFTPNNGYHVQSILIDGNELSRSELIDAINNGYTFSNVTQNHTISVTFAINTYIIEASANDFGTITPSGNVQVNYGANQIFSFEPSTGYKIDKVYVDGVNIGDVQTYTFNNITSNHTINVTFKKITYTITSSAGANGSISPEGISNVIYGENINYTFTPNTGYKVKDVKVNNISVGAITNYSFSNVTSNQTISVEFEKIILTINVICGENGTVSPSGEINVEYGENKTFTISPDENYDISYIELNNERISIVYTIFLNNITENQTLKVMFGQIFLITATSDENGTITPSTTIVYGNQKRFDFVPNIGYKIKDVKIDNVSIGAVDHYIFVDVDNNHTISVEYEIQKFNILLNVDGKGTAVAYKTLKNIPYAEDRIITISAEKGWELCEVYINERSVDITDNKLIINDIIEDLNIRIIFKEKEPTLLFGLGKRPSIIIGATVISIILIGLIIKLRNNSKKKKT